jgi:hypothetical protein
MIRSPLCPSAVRLAIVGVVLFAVVGCGGGGKEATAEGRVKPKGRVLKNGLPLDINAAGLPPGDPGLQVIFIKMGTTDAGTEIPAQITDPATGSFELAGLDGKGIPPGKYRVAVILAPSGSPDQLKGKYDQKNSKIEKEITGTEDVIIDLGK